MFDIPRLFIGIVQWAACFLHMQAFKRRCKPLPFAALCLLWLSVFIAQNILFGYLPFNFGIRFLNSCLSLILMIAFMFSTTAINIKDAVFYGFSSYVLGGFISSVHWQLYYYFYIGYDFAKELWFIILWLVFIYCACFILIILINSRVFKNSKIPCASYKDIIFIVIMTVFCIVSANIKFFNNDGVWMERRIREWNEIRTLVWMFGLVVIYFNRVMSDKIMYMAELTAINRVMDNQFKQYKIYKQNNEIINRHYHDLKHQLDIILSEDDHDKRSEYLEEMQKAIKLRQSEKVTGNKVVDVILSGKSIDCVNNGITLSVVADGHLLDFMSQMDLCSVLGNCIDNAVEYVENIEDKQKRIIQVALFRQGSMIVLRVKNYFDGKLEYNGENVVTTKENKLDHGYGLKSIRMITEKYGGNMKIVTEDGWFTLCLLFPLGNETTKLD